MRRYWTRFIGHIKNLSPTGQRRAVGFGVLAVGVLLGYYYFFSDGLPIIFGPTARAADIAAGRELFEHEWQPNDPERSRRRPRARSSTPSPAPPATSRAASAAAGGTNTTR